MTSETVESNTLEQWVKDVQKFFSGYPHLNELANSGRMLHTQMTSDEFAEVGRALLDVSSNFMEMERNQRRARKLFTVGYGLFADPLFSSSHEKSAERFIILWHNPEDRALLVNIVNANV